MNTVSLQPPPPFDPSLLRRPGRIKVSMECPREAPHLVMALMGHLVVLEACPEMADRTIEYIAYSMLFEDLGERSTLVQFPLYHIEVFTNAGPALHKAISFTAVRVAEDELRMREPALTAQQAPPPPEAVERRRGL